MRDVAPQAPQTPQTPQPPQLPVIQAPSRVTTGTPSSVYQAFRNQREELGNQIDRLEDQRRDLSEKLQNPMINDADKKGLEQRIGVVDQRILALEKQVEAADASVATAAAVPGAVIPPPPFERSGPPEEFYVLTGIFMFVVLFPLTIAYARRLWRRGAAAIMTIPQEIYDRFARVDQSLDAIAIEVERIGEGQRFLTRIHTEQQRALGAGQAERIESKLRDAERQR
jgi:hypothetical protein